MIGFLIPVLMGVFNALIAFFTQYMTRKVALVLSSSALFIGLTVAMVAAMNGLIAGISLAMPSSISLAAGWFLPDNLTACIGAYYSAVAVKFVYHLKTDIVKMWSQ